MLCVVLETGSHKSKAGFELLILLPLPLECRDYRYMPPDLACVHMYIYDGWLLICPNRLSFLKAKCLSSLAFVSGPPLDAGNRVFTEQGVAGSQAFVILNGPVVLKLQVRETNTCQEKQEMNLLGAGAFEDSHGPGSCY